MRRSALMQFKTFESRGEYKDIQIELDAILDGDVDAINIKSSGSTEFTGNVVAKDARLGGVCKIGGNCTIDNLQVCGESKVAGNIISDEFILDGKMVCNGKSIECNNFKLCGSLTSNATLKSSLINGKGGLTLDKIECNNIDLIFTKKTKVKEVIGSEIKIFGGKQKSFIGKLISKVAPLVEINNINGENVTLENVNSRLVVGENIKIGENCIINKIEYTGEITISTKSKVVEKIKI